MGADVVHLQQILAAYGSDVVFRFLRQPSAAARVITVHELDAEQTDHPENNQTYNYAQALIVHDNAMKNKLVSLGVARDLVYVVPQGTDLKEGENVARDGIVFYGGHHFNEGKGIGVLLTPIGASRIDMPDRRRVCEFMGTMERRQKRFSTKPMNSASPTAWNGSTMFR